MKYKAEVLAALRSGDWEQAGGQLGITHTNKRCCLGVMCEVALQNGLDLEVVDFPNTGGNLQFDESAFLLPERVQDFFGLGNSPTIPLEALTDEQRAKLDHSPSFVELTDLNDSGEFSFEEIADLIEEHL